MGKLTAVAALFAAIVLAAPAAKAQDIGGIILGGHPGGGGTASTGGASGGGGGHSGVGMAVAGPAIVIGVGVCLYVGGQKWRRPPRTDCEWDRAADDTFGCFLPVIHLGRALAGPTEACRKAAQKARRRH